MGEKSGIHSITDFIKYMDNMGMSDKNYYLKHYINVKGAEIRWNADFPAISGQCNKCGKVLNGFTLNTGKCSNPNCDADNIDIQKLKKKWIWAQLKCKDVNGDQAIHSLMSTNEFGIKVISKVTQSRITNIKTFLEYIDKPMEMNDLLQLQKTMKVIHDCSVIIGRNKNPNKPRGTETMIMQIDVSKQ